LESAGCTPRRGLVFTPQILYGTSNSDRVSW
jgi:hypothetical protein